MIALLLALACCSPCTEARKKEPESKQNLQAWKDETLCWGDYCGPRVVNLGDWDPRPADKDWTP